MEDVVIKVEGLSKQYRLGEVGTGTMKEDVKRWWAKMRRKEDPFLKLSEENNHVKLSGTSYVWALQNINFEVTKGSVVGIIGRNGAGKSTLLKILSRTTSPTLGSIKIKGRVASLLEVGTGFHPELSGRENIFLNGAVLGMREHEITRKFDEIVDFAGVGAYIDTPVKRYSSGMYIRLAFAVAAHLESEILIVDEVLAVGDIEFQKKCLGKMGDISRGEGRTVLFVSHNMPVIQNLCTSAIYIENGRIEYEKAATDEVIGYYMSKNKKMLSVSVTDRKDREGNGKIRVTDLQMLDEKNCIVEAAISGGTVLFKIDYVVNSFLPDYRNVYVSISLTRDDGFLITLLSNEFTSDSLKITSTKGSIYCKINKLPVGNGEYTMNVMIKGNDEIYDWVRDCKVIQVEDGDFFKTGKTVPNTHRGLLIDQEWA